MKTVAQVLRACAVCGDPFRIVETRTVTRCPECIAAGRTHCVRCGAAAMVPAGRSGFVVCATCRSEGWRHWQQPQDRRTTVTCTTCGQSFAVFPSRVGSTRRCPACVAAGRTRCAVCHGVMATRPGAGSRPVCEVCRASRTEGPRGALVPILGPGRERSPRVTLVCRGHEEFGHARRCWGEREFTAYRATRLRTYREDGTYVCLPCQGRGQVAHIARLLALGEAGWPNLTPQAADAIADLAPDGRVRSWEKAVAIHRVRARQMRGGVLSPEVALRARLAHREKLARLGVSSTGVPRGWTTAAGKWRRGVNVEIRACRACGTLLLASLAPGAQRPTLHQRCMVALMRSPDARAVLSARRRLRDDGKAAWQIDRALGPGLPVPPRHGREPDATILTRDFRWAVLHLLGGDTQRGLAAQDHVTPALVSQGIHRVIALLPESGLADQRFAPLVEALREASAVAPPPAAAPS